LAHHIGVFWEHIDEFVAPLFRIFTNRFVIQLVLDYWKEIIICIAIVALFLAHQLFTRWKQAHLHSYALCEIGVGLITLASLLPWSAGSGLLSFDSYKDLLTGQNILVTAAKVMGGIYLGVRGEENRQKALATGRGQTAS
jgi:hypothetical protein